MFWTMVTLAPEGGFPVSADYDITTNFAKVSFDQTGTYTVTLKLVDRNNGDAVLAETTNTIQVTRRSSGGSGHADTRYDVDVKDAANGTVKASSTGASEGATVTLTVTADEGYTLDKLTVTDKNDKEVKLTNKGDGKYTFTMPWLRMSRLRPASLRAAHCRSPMYRSMTGSMMRCVTCMKMAA